MPSSKTATTSPPSRRDEHKKRTRRALQQAALELFAEQGYDVTTTEEIAERARVSARTFFRYFATKESALFLGEYTWFQSFESLYLEQPASLGEIDAIRETLVVLAPGLAKRRRSLLLYEKATASSPTLRGRIQDRHEDEVVTLARSIAERRKVPEPDEHCTLLADVVLLTYRRAIDRWLAGPASVDPAEVIADEMKILADLF